MGAIRDLNLNFISESETEKEQDSPTSEDSKNAGSVDTFGRKVNKSCLIEGSTTSPRDKILMEKKIITDKILIADDQPINIEVLRDHCTELDCI
jgi:hypothetical protein